MCFSPQSTRISINNFFKNKEKSSCKKITQRQDYNKMSITKKLSSRNLEKSNSKKKPIFAKWKNQSCAQKQEEEEMDIVRLIGVKRRLRH